MKNMIRLFFGAFVGNAVLAPVGFMGPGSDMPGIGATILAVASFMVMAYLYYLDSRTRRGFITILTKYHSAANGNLEIRSKIEQAMDDVMVRDSLVSISHDIGQIHSLLVEKNLLSEAADLKIAEDVDI
jgi:hypothetical protein